MNDKQKRFLGIGGVGVGGLLVYRHLHASRGSAGGGTMTNGLAQASSTTGSITPFVPQAPIVVPPGESVYDPNSQGLINTPGAIPAPQAVAASGPAYVVNVAAPKPPRGTKKRMRRPATRKPARHKKKVKATK